jgi:long-chain acyl-CoA synthetase
VLSYAALSGAAGWIADRVRSSGIGPGGLVATIMPNGVEFAACYYGVQLAGAAVVPLSPNHDDSTLARRLSTCAPGLLLLGAGSPASARTLAAASGTPVLEVDAEMFTAELSAAELSTAELSTAELSTAELSTAELSAAGCPADPGAHTADPGAVAVLAYGQPAAQPPAPAELTQANLARAASALASTVLRLSPEDTVLSTFPMLAVLGQTCGINATVAAGACLSIPARFDPPEILRVIAEQRVTVLATFPALLPGLLREAQGGAADVSSLRTILGAGGTTVPSRLREPLESAFGCEVLECYGPAESAGLACATRPGDQYPGSVGAAVDGVELRVSTGGSRDAAPGVSGELLLRGPHTMAGYRGDPRATTMALRDGWLHTGTEARMDQDGHVYLLDGGWIGRVKAPRAGRESRLRRAWRRLHPTDPAPH